ncbi:MAG: T9SS type A sorting domain-containing protein [Calditrichaeota bacterium]|nr:T9SS type A sorting domain-containing protein [Calditrichota bacterium]
MKRTATLFLLPALLLVLVGGVMAQPAAKITTPGISDRMVAVDTTDIYTRASTGLPNVGIGDMLYLAGNAGDTAITAWAWELTARPNQSQAALSAADRPVVTLLTDRAGTYRVTLRVTSAAGQSNPVTMAINAGNYVGVGGIVGNPAVPQCAACHAGQVDDIVSLWRESKHAEMFTSMYDGREGTRYRSICVRCHVVGYDADNAAANLGFDDRAREENWTFRDSAAGGLREGAFADMVQRFPLTAAKANVQCEACHGPGSQHNGMTADNKMAKTIDNGVCAKCHDSGTHHVRPAEIKNSKHSAPTRSPTGAGRSGCVKCHTGRAFIQHLQGIPDSLKSVEYIPINCITCHDPHDATNPYQLRTVAPVRLENGVEVNYGNGNMCANCHKSRRNAVTYVETTRGSTHFGPHYSAQSDMLRGTNGIEYGMQMRSSPHYMIVENGCVGCHMAEGRHNNGDPAQFKLGDHSFAVKTANGIENTEVCATCHGEIEGFEEIMADSDWDGDGNVEGVSHEIEGMLERIALLLPPIGENRVVIDTSYSLSQKKAVWNYRLVEEDGSMGMHNARYARSILQATYDRREDLGVERIDGPLPGVYSLSAAYPNPFNPATTVNYSLARDGNVTLKVYDMAGREVMTAVNRHQTAGSYKAAVLMIGQPSGVYVLRMEAGDFTSSVKLVLVK